MIWRELLTWAEETLKAAGVSEYAVDAWYLFSEAFEMNRARFFLCREQEIPDEYGAESWFAGERSDAEESGENTQLTRFVYMIRQRSRRIPLQQIIGHQEFMGLDFLVNEHVLCPRQDTEVLVEIVLAEMDTCARETDGRSEQKDKEEDDLPLKVLDMCAGSGCIGISLERLSCRPVRVLAADVSDEAIKVAVSNAEKNSCTHYRIIKSDLFQEINEQFHVIVSNPPYIPSKVIDTLDDEVRLYEPRLALDGEADGLSFYRRISAAARDHLLPEGRIYYEIGYDQGQAVSEILAENGFADIRVIKDLAGLDRVAAARR